jgi:hypothetical protein
MLLSNQGIALIIAKIMPVYGTAVDKRTVTKRFGKYFYSEKHADHYAQMKMVRETDSVRGGCC